MPTTSSAGGFVFHNAGPLTTTWTAPSACSTLPANTRVSGAADPRIPGVFSRVVLGSCKVGTWYPHCVPNGEEVDAIYPSTANYLELASRYYYYSPVLVCPDAYETAGIIAMDGSSASYQEGGPTSFPTANFPLNALTSVLAPAETAVAYSPSGFSANLAHGCYSYFPVIELAGRTGCLCRLTNATHETATRTFDCFGETTTQTEDVLAAVTSETIGREPFTFTADEWEFAMEGDRNPYPTDEPLQGMALAPFILMVNGGGDGGAER